MDRASINSHPDLSHTDARLRQRIHAGWTAVVDQVEYFRDHFGTAKSRWKSDGTRVTEVDETISRKIFEFLWKSFPDDDYCSEESAETAQPIALKSEFAWVLDPVDGTNNYAVGVPECAISLGLLRHGVPVYGFIYDFGRDNLLQGGPELGSMEGPRTIHAAESLVNEKLTLCMHFPIPLADLDRMREVLQVWRIRCPGSAAIGLANVATGRLDGCLEFRSKPWDCAAGYAICEGAGARFHFVRNPAFPMTSFSPRMQACPFRVGSSLFHLEVSRTLGLD